MPKPNPIRTLKGIKDRVRYMLHFPKTFKIFQNVINSSDIHVIWQLNVSDHVIPKPKVDKRV